MQPRVHCCSTEQRAYSKVRKVEFPLPSALLGKFPEDGQGQVVCSGVWGQRVWTEGSMRKK